MLVYEMTTYDYKGEIILHVEDTGAEARQGMTEHLLDDLYSKKILECRSITRFKRVYHYDGTATFTVYYNNGCKRIYEVREH